MFRVGCALAVLVACGPTNAVSPHAAAAKPWTCPSSLGDPKLYAPPADPAVSPPQRCGASGADEAYIRIAGPGELSFSVDPPGKATGCRRPGEACDKIDLGSFLETATQDLKAHGIQDVAWGLGRCWHNEPVRKISFIVYHWRDAGAAISLVAAQMHAWNLSESLDVSVESIPCGTL
jgi:hypothetical protein